jgi:hypothetical protein
VYFFVQFLAPVLSLEKKKQIQTILSLLSTTPDVWETQENGGK